MKKIVFCAVIFLGAKGFCGYSESQFFFDRGETPRAVHFTANGFKASSTYQLKFYGKTGDSATETQYVKILSKDNQWLSVNEDSWPDDLPTFTTGDNGYKEGWVYVKNSGIATLGTYTCAFSVKEVGTGGEIMKPGTFRPLTIMDMNTEGGWLEGIVYKNGAPAVNSHLIFLEESGKVLGSVDSEPNRISDDNQGSPDGYFKIALPAGITVSTITDWDGNLYELPNPSQKGMNIASTDNPSKGNWVIVAGATVSISGGNILSTTGSVVINEIMYRPSDDNLNEWIELYNRGNSDVSLENWQLYDGNLRNFTLRAGSWTITPGSYTILARKPGTFTLIYGTPTNIIECPMVLTDIGKSIALQTPTNERIGTVTYSNDWGANGNGKTLERIDPTGSDTAQSNWVQSVGTGTPGRINSQTEQPATIVITQNPDTVNADNGTSTISGYVKNYIGGPATATVNWTTTGGIITATSTTTNGTATAVFSCTKAGTWTITGTVTNTVTATTTVIVTAGSPATITLTAPVSPVSADIGTTTIQGYVRDGAGNPVGTIVYWTTTGGAITATSTTTNGTATAVFSCTKAGNYTITGTVTDTVTATTTIIVTAGLPATITLTTPPGPMSADIGTT
ncbi:lamin tail domain-containing protein, partial [bacterium]|nr:lamin tail domain-containing protein [bacterium]